MTKIYGALVVILGKIFKIKNKKIELHYYQVNNGNTIKKDASSNS